MAAYARIRIGLVAALLLLLAPLSATAAPMPDRTLDPGTRFFRPGLQPEPAAIQQLHDLLRQRRFEDAELIFQMEMQPRAVWLTRGTPNDVRRLARKTVRDAREDGQVAVLVAYNIPGRDCGGLSAGGALTTADYEAWMVGLASGIGADKAVVILEPDSLGLLPSSCGGPNASFPFTDPERFTELNFAVDRLAQQPRTLVYLDGTHSHWLAVGDIAQRLVTAGMQRAQGFFLNVSNFRATSDLTRYGTWISKCIAFANNPADGGWRLGHYDFCASQYFSPFGPVNPDDASTWHFTDQWYDANLGTAVPTTHFVVDTSRNGQGPWIPPSPPYPNAAVAQDWCDPPGRGLGIRSTARTGVPLADAFLWIKVPGESDGSCSRGLGPAGSTVDPEWGVVDPAAGLWFPQQALQLARLATPPLERGPEELR
jgi:endoglucanase